MQRALEKMRTQVLSMAGKYSDARKRKELDQVFSLLEQEPKAGQVQSQRIMVLLRAVMNAQPGSARVVNEFLRSPDVASILQAGGNYNLE